jgi:RimJ/RimL family protein N-acetyltransferase
MTACVKRQLAFLSQLVTLATNPSTSPLHLPVILASTWDTNPASSRILTKCGFQAVHRDMATKLTGEDIAFTRHQWFGSQSKEEEETLQRPQAQVKQS